MSDLKVSDIDEFERENYESDPPLDWMVKKNQILKFVCECARKALTEKPVPDGSLLPDCMMPDGADPCKGYQQLSARVAELEDIAYLTAAWECSTCGHILARAAKTPIPHCPNGHGALQRISERVRAESAEKDRDRLQRELADSVVTHNKAWLLCQKHDQRFPKPAPTLTEYVQHYVERAESAEKRLEEAGRVLQKCRIGHYYCEDSWYSCPQAEGGCADDRRGPACDCGADKWNARVDAAIEALGK